MGRVCCVACGVCDVSVSGLSGDRERTEIRPRSDLGRWKRTQNVSHEGPWETEKERNVKIGPAPATNTSGDRPAPEAPTLFYVFCVAFAPLWGRCCMIFRCFRHDFSAADFCSHFSSNLGRFGMSFWTSF